MCSFMYLHANICVYVCKLPLYEVSREVLFIKFEKLGMIRNGHLCVRGKPFLESENSYLPRVNLYVIGILKVIKLNKNYLNKSLKCWGQSLGHSHSYNKKLWLWAVVYSYQSCPYKCILKYYFRNITMEHIDLQLLVKNIFFHNFIFITSYLINFV